MAITTYNATLKEWENIIRVNLKVTNPALLKSGSLGILTNYLAGIKYDSMQYYSKVFQESNVGLAQDFNSLLYHSTIFGAELQLANPATLTSSLVIPELKLSQVQKLEYHLYKNSTFTDINGLPFILETDINVEITSGVVKATSWDKENGSQRLAVTRAPNPNVPNTFLYLINNSSIRQYKRTFQNFVCTSYNVGETFEFSTGISDISQLKEISVWVNTGDNLDLNLLDQVDTDEIEDITTPGKTYNIEKYNIKYHKFGSSSRDKDMFLEIFENSLNFETGDGLHGVVVPGGAQIIVEIQLTQGKRGNIPNSEFIVRNVQVTEFYNRTNITNSYETSVNGISTTGSSGGGNVQTVEEMRSSILANISTRNSVVTENDYENMFQNNGIKPFVDAKFIDAQAFVFLFNVLYDNDNIVKSTAVNMKEIDLLENPFYPTYDYMGERLISPFYYKNKTANTVDAYILNPLYYIPWTAAEDSPEENDNNIFRVDVAITYDFTVNKSYIEIVDGAIDEYIYHFKAEQFGSTMILDSTNNFKLAIDDRYTDEYCVLNEALTGLKLTVEQSGDILATYVSDGPCHPLVLKQTFYKYFQEEEEAPAYPITSSFSYLDNALNNSIATGENLITAPPEGYSTYILRVPFFSEEYFYLLPSDEIFEIVDKYFKVKLHDQIINYNTQLTQTFHNTIDIPTRYYPYLFEKNNNGVLTTPKLPIDIKIFVDNEQFLTARYNDTEELKLDIKIFCINYLKSEEGFMIEFYETNLEKAIWNQFAPMLRNVRVDSPSLFTVKNSAMIYEDIQDNLSFEDVLTFVPPYFHYDYANIQITLDI